MKNTSAMKRCFGAQMLEKMSQNCHGLCFSWMKRCGRNWFFRFLSLSEQVTGGDIGSFISSIIEVTGKDMCDRMIAPSICNVLSLLANIKENSRDPQ